MGTLENLIGDVDVDVDVDRGVRDVDRGLY